MLLLLALAACGSNRLPPADLDGRTTTTSSTPLDDEPELGATRAPTDADLVVFPEVVVRPFPSRLLGTNVPAWLGAERLSSPEFIDATIESGATVLRMPGGSWSNAYDWRACERVDQEGCWFQGAARPSDFMSFIEATGIEGMWTVSINHTAQNAAALVAFFNGSVDDSTRIGPDRDGVDWGTVGDWASLRADHGHEEPVRIELWEVGNEVYGGTPDSGGDECADFGWEVVWTCDGAEYVAGTAERDGYLEIREAMLAVDPDISVGAVGVPAVDDWNDWGSEVIEGAGTALDFYVVHAYGFNESPDEDEVLDAPRDLAASFLPSLRRALPSVPIAVTEYHIVSMESGDTRQSMVRTMGGLYLASWVGHMLDDGVSIANQWNLANGVTASGTDYGAIDLDSGAARPSYESLRLWSEFVGSDVVSIDGEEDFRDLDAHAALRPDGSLALLVVNRAREPVRTTVTTFESDPIDAAQLRCVMTDDLTATSFEQLDEDLVPEDASVAVEWPGWSICLAVIERG